MADNLVMEEREEYMVSPTGSRASLRPAHFLRPSVTSIDGPVAAPSLDSPTSSATATHKDLSFKVNFLGWRIPQEKWQTWVDQMQSLHHSTWKKVGIFDAVMSSKCCIRRHQDLIFNFVEKWCPATNTMVFPWGEATITLEDAMVIGGFSVLGESVFAPPPEDDESQQTVKKLLAARSNICKSDARSPAQYKWIAKFMGGGSEIEHEAFLAYWLSRFVFPSSRNIITRSVFPIAVHLARGTKIALAPAVLAGIYKSLTLLKTAVAAARKVSSHSQSENGDFEVTVPAPLTLVQVWVWERFPSLRPKPIFIEQNEPRLARWDTSKKSNIEEDISAIIDSAGEEFQWRPYATTAGNAVSRMFYKDQEYWAAVDGDLDGLIRCLRTSELVSFEQDCIEQYLPHRVAMQFGMDQDLPGYVPRVNVNPVIAWMDYIRPIGDAKIYVPPRLFEADVTTRYFKWWKKLNLGWRKISESDVDGTKDLFGKISEDDSVLPPPIFPQELKTVSNSGVSEKFRDRENGEFVHMQSPLSSSADNEKSSCSKGSKREFVECSSDYNSVASLSGFEKTVAESSGTGFHEKTRPRDDDNDDSRGGIGGLEERVRIIEKLCALIKSGKIGLPLMKKVRQ